MSNYGRGEGIDNVTQHIESGGSDGVFGVVHSLLAGRTAKQAAARTFGERSRNGLYRVFYIGQSLVTFGLLAANVRRQPSRELYRIEGPLAFLMHAIQASAVIYATAAAGQVGLRCITVQDSFLAWLGDGHVPPEPVAQGPALDDEGRQHGSLHEEARMREAFGDDDAYLNSGVPFYVSAPEKNGLEVTSSVANLEGTPK